MKEFSSFLKKTSVSCGCFLVLFSAYPAKSAVKPAPDDTVSVSAHEKLSKLGISEVSFLLSCRNALEATVTFRCDHLSNLLSDHPLPYTIITGPCRSHEFLHFRKEKADLRSAYGGWIFKYKFGLPSRAKSLDYPYGLPYSRKEHYRLIQGFRGKFSHLKGFQEEYATDFAMPEGTTVRASRQGKVIACRKDSSAGGASADFLGSQNYVVIKHNDGTYGMYMHFKKNGVFVKPGQSVAEQDKLGLSGATGWTGRPHLHFSVYRVRDGFVSESIPFSFKVGGVLLPALKEGHIY